MGVFLAICFFIIVILSLCFENRRISKTVYYFIGIFLIIYICIADKSELPDYSTYVNYLKTNYSIIEPTFIIFSAIINTYLGGQEIFLFIIYAIIGVGLKLIAIRELTALPILTLAFYVSSYFIYHELIQIRAGAAAACLLLAIKPLYERNFKKFITISIVAILFHASAICILPLWVINPHKRHGMIYLLIIPIAIILYILNVDCISILQHLPIPYLQDKISGYADISIESMDRGLLTADEYNPFVTWYLFKVAIAYYFWLIIGRINQYNKFALLLLKIYTIGIACLWLFGSVPPLATRLSEFLTSVQIILIPLSIYSIKNRLLAYIPTFIIGCMWLIWNINSFIHI